MISARVTIQVGYDELPDRSSTAATCYSLGGVYCCHIATATRAMGKITAAGAGRSIVRYDNGLDWTGLDGNGCSPNSSSSRLYAVHAEKGEEGQPAPANNIWGTKQRPQVITTPHTRLQKVFLSLMCARGFFSLAEKHDCITHHGRAYREHASNKLSVLWTAETCFQVFRTRSSQMLWFTYKKKNVAR